MTRAIESTVGVILVILVLPLLAVAIAGLWITKVRPVLVERNIPLRDGWVRHLAFNSLANGFGLFLRRYQIDRLPLLFRVVSGKTRLGELWDFPRGR
ncbi:MAG: hypothetical protein V4689_11665 [Verrucomicrobiota bacterium]